jgi:hypothetical protein
MLLSVKKSPMKSLEASESVKIAKTAKVERSLPFSSVDDGGDRKGRRKIKIEFIKDKNRRHITFSKRKAGIMKKVWFMFVLTPGV